MSTSIVSCTSRLAAVSILLILAGCSGLGYQPPNQPAVPVGAQLELNLSAPVPVDQNGIYIQDRRVVSKAQLDPEQVYCQVVVDGYQQVGARQMSVEPGSFRVERVRLYNDYVYNPVIYANTDDNFYLPTFGIDYRTELHLVSSAQPDVVALYCTEHRARYERRARYPERAQFDATLGDFVTLP